MTYPWPTLMPMGIVVISCVRPYVQPSMGLGLCIAYKALGRNGLQFGMLMYPDGLHSAFMDAYGYTSLLDHIYIQNCTIFMSGVLDTYYSDHDAIFADIALHGYQQ